MKIDNSDDHDEIIAAFWMAIGDIERTLSSFLTLRYYRVHSRLQTLAAFNSHTAHVQFNIDRQ